MPPRRIYEHSGPAELVLEGENLTPDTLKLFHNGVLYTPLESSDTYAYYLLGDNGTNKVMLNGKNFCTVIVKDIVVPDNVPRKFRGNQVATTGTAGGNLNIINSMNVTGVNCINYPYIATDTHPYFLFFFFNEDMEGDGFNVVNGSINKAEIIGGSMRVNVSVTDVTKAAYITYQGFVVAVFNYSA